MNLFSFDDYRLYLKERIESLPAGGRGELARMATHLGVHSTLMSLILSGKRDLNGEQAFDLCDYLQLSPLETEFFLLLVQIRRAGTARLRRHLEQQMRRIRDDSMKVSARVKAPKVLKEADKALFYSTWLHSAIRLYCSTSPEGRTLDEIVARFDRGRVQTLECLDFLQRAGLVSESRGRFQMAVQKTFLPFGSPHLIRHHANWRLKSLEGADRITAEELMVTSPFSISREDFQRLKRMLLAFVAESSDIIRESGADDVACLNIDLFWVK